MTISYRAISFVSDANSGFEIIILIKAFISAPIHSLPLATCHLVHTAYFNVIDVYNSESL